MTNNITQVFGITPEELKQDILKDVKDELKSIAQNFKPKEPPEYLTRKEVAKILKISLVTVHDWNKKKILNPYRLGNLIRYKSNEIDDALIRINTKNS